MKTLEQIEAYLENKMSQEKRREFELQLAGNENFRKEFEEIKAVIMGVRSAAAISFAEKVRGWEKTLQGGGKIQLDAKIAPLYKSQDSAEDYGYGQNEERQAHLKRRPLLLALAASVVILIGIFFVYQPQKTDANSLYAAHFVQPENPFTTMGDQTSLQLEAFQAYERDDFTKAISLYHQILEDSPTNAQVQYLLGVTYMEAGEGLEAVQIFDQVINQDNVYDEKAEWYKALTFIKLDNMDAAKKQLEEIVNSERHDYKKEATALLKKI